MLHGKIERMHDYLLAHDLGTSGDKAVLFDVSNLTIAGSVFCGYETHYMDDGGVEHDPESWWKAVCSSTKKLIAVSGITPSQIKGVSFSAIMNSCLPVDNRGLPLRRAMIWCDQRGKTALPRLFEFASEDDFYSKTGHRLNGTYAVAKMAAYKDLEPELFARTRFFLQAKDYIIMKLSGVIATDFSDASHLGVLDQHAKCYWKDLLDYLGIPISMLPPLHASTEVVGRVTKQAAEATGLCEGTPVAMGGGDGCCATAGAGVYKPGVAYSVLGTSAWNGSVSNNALSSPSKVTFSFIHLDGMHHVTIGTMQSAGHSLEWMLKTLFPDDYEKRKDDLFCKVNADISRMLDGGERKKLLYLPYLLGERSPWWDSDARGCLIGLDSSTSRMDSVLACMEGVAFNLKVILEDMEKTAGPLELKIIGGGARNDAWLKVIASAWNREISALKYQSEATSLGAILCAGIGVGIFDGFSIIDRINPVVKKIKPQDNLAAHYEKIFPVFKKSYLSLADVFKMLREQRT